jgi:hypothetical protein
MDGRADDRGLIAAFPASSVMSLSSYITLKQMTPPVRSDGARIFCMQPSKGQGCVQYLFSQPQKINWN